jgi:hypothetical protein
MPYPPLVGLADAEAYRQYFYRCYCRAPITTFDGIQVRFRKAKFEHAFFDRSIRRSGAKDTFSSERAQRIDWIRSALQDPTAELYVGWDRLHKAHTIDRRVAVVCGDYVVVIALVGSDAADFVTAFVADSPSSLAQIRKGPRWPRK